MSPRTSTQGTRAPYAGLRNPVGTHVQVGKGLVAGALAQADALGCETIQVFAGNPRGWALSNGDPKNNPEIQPHDLPALLSEN